MKKIIYFISLLFYTSLLFAQSSTNMSISLIGGTHGIGLRGEMNSGISLLSNSKTIYYADITGANRKFATSTFTFKNTKYSSNVWILNIGLGVTQEFEVKQNLIVSPYLGLRFEYARFKDGALVEGIGTDNLIRYWNGKQVGPTVENGYGNVIMIDVGSRIGYKINQAFEIGGSIGFSPIKYSTANTLFGKYWGTSPYANDYNINRSPIRFEGVIKYSF